MSKTTLLYKDIAPGADTDAAVSAPSSQGFTDPTQLPFGTSEAPALTCELNQWGLDGTFILAEEIEPAFWSTEMSGADGSFASGQEPVITIVFDEQYSSVGISFRFDTPTGGFCSALNIKWYQQDVLREDVDFAPDAVEYFCQKKVTSYDKLVITIKKTNLPYRYAKIDHIIFGLHRSFGMSELRSASAVNEMNLISTELPSSTLNWTLDSREDVDFMFQLKQPVEISNDDRLIGVYYVSSYSRKSRRIYPITCCDAIGVLGDIPFGGGVYTAASAKALVVELASPFEVEFDADVQDMQLTGVIKSGTRRSALQQVLFAWGECASTDGRASIRIFTPGVEPKVISANQTFLGTTVNTDAIVTQVQVVAHTYTASTNGTVTINGTKYEDTEEIFSVSNPDVTATDKQNIKKISDATLVSPAIAQAVAQRVYEYYSRRNTNKAKIVYNGEKLGDCLTIPNSWGSANTGNLAKMEIKLSNTVVYSSESKGV